MVRAMFIHRRAALLLIPLSLMAACNKRQDAAKAVAAQAPSSPASAADNSEVAAVPSCLPKEAPKAVGAPDDSRESLMREVFPGWTKKLGCVFAEMDDE